MYFDNAATTFPKPESVARAVAAAVTKFGGNPGRSGHNMSMNAAAKVFACRGKAAKMFDCESIEQVIFTKNCTEATNLAVKGYVKPSDHIIISNLEHNAVARPVYALCQSQNVECSVADVVEGDDEQTVLNFRKAIKPGKTTTIITTHASNVFGVVVPIQKIYALCEEYSIRLIVDAAQTAGVLPISHKKMPKACICTAGHKGLYGPTGTGLLIVPRDELPDTIIEGGTGSFSQELEQPQLLPDRFESGTVNTVGICGLEAGLDFVLKTGIEKILRHERQLACRMYDNLKTIPKVCLYTKRPDDAAHVPVISFNIKGMTSEEVAAQLNEKGISVRAGLHCAPLAHRAFGTLETGVVRASFSAFHAQTDVDRFVQVTRKIAQTSGRLPANR